MLRRVLRRVVRVARPREGERVEDQSVSKTDVMTMSAASAPPNYVKAYDDGRPRH